MKVYRRYLVSKMAFVSTAAYIDTSDVSSIYIDGRIMPREDQYGRYNNSAEF
jgi:hypothetical protein